MQGGFVRAQLSRTALRLLCRTWPQRLEGVRGSPAASRSSARCARCYLSLFLSLSLNSSSAFFLAGRARSLLSLCRIAVRRILGKSRLDLIHILPVPDPIKQFLLHEHS